MDSASGSPQTPTRRGSRARSMVFFKSKATEMSDPLFSLSRRALVKGAGLGIGAGLVAGIAEQASAEPTAAIWSAEYWSQKGDVKLNVWRKRAGAPKQGEQALPIVFLVHGSSNSP